MAKHSLPRDVRTELAEHLGQEPRVLAWAQGRQGEWLVATRREFAHLAEGSWQVWPWEKILGGGWRKDPAGLHWYTLDGRWDCPIQAPGELPAVFRERVQASTVMTASHDLPGGAITLTARRAPGVDGPVEWLASASGEVDLNDPVISAFVVQETDRLRTEYGL